MNEAPQLEIVELGDAKEETKGVHQALITETNPAGPYRQAD